LIISQFHKYIELSFTDNLYKMLLLGWLGFDVQFT